MKRIKGYRDHILRGNRSGQRVARLTRAYRAIYEISENNLLRIIEVQEVNKHEYKK